MGEANGKQTKRDAKSASAVRENSMSSQVTSLQQPAPEEQKDLSAAQSEYLKSMRISVRQMKDCDGRPLSELLDELRAETMGNDKTHQDD